MNDMILIMIIIVSNGKFISYLGEPSSSNLPSNNGTNCSFLALKISEKWHLEIKSIGSDRKRFVDIVEDIIQHFPKRINPFCDIWRHYDLLEAADILSENHLLENTPHLKELSKGTRIFSNDGREDPFKVACRV